MSWSEKSDLIRSQNLCYRCLKFGHRKSDCKVKLKCSSCGEPHARSMCARLPSNQRNNTGREEVHSDVPATAANANHSCSKDVLMKTLLVKMAGPKGTRIVRLLFDEGNQQSSGGQRTISAIGSPLVGEEWTRNVLFGGILTEPRKIKKFKVQVQSLDGRFKRDVILRESATICGDIPRIPAGPWMNELKKRKIFLSDFEMSHVDHPDIELLIGSDYWGQFVCGRPLMLSCGLVAVETVFGWTLSGPVPGKEVSMGVMTIHHSLFNAEACVQDLWKLETLGINDPTEHKTKNEKEEEARQHFLRTVSRTQEGRYAVALPWVDEERTIPDNKVVAEKRGNYELYDKVFQDWEKEGLIEEVVGGVDRPCHYLPHRPVYKLESKTTPVRPVYDASCKNGRNPSLNDLLEKGPNLLELIPAILLRFREKKIGVISDIRKAFQMIEVAKPDQDFQRFLWWNNKENPRMKIYRHKRVVFGVKCSPFLLGAVIEYHLSQVTGEEKEYANKLLRSLYVDNCVTMELRQWERSSSGAAGISFEQFDKDENGQETTVVLGLNWDKKKDELSVSVPKEEKIENISKRVMLSKVKQFFDPMGYLSPTTIIPKLLLQKTWTEKNSWDEELDSTIKKEFEDWWTQAQLLKEMKIPRWAFCSSYESNRQFHVLCDASQHAYAAAVFVRVEDNEQVSVQLLQAKARVAPMKKVTIPRLELLGCTIAARLSKSVKEALSAEETPTFYWSDSTTALAWIKRNDKWGTFVGNRVKEICSLSNSMEWNHVPGVLNPADLPSRGCSPSHLINSKWWAGPDWLKKPKSEWPSSKEEADDDQVRAEMKKVAKVSLIATLPSTPWYGEMSCSFVKNVRVVAMLKRSIRRFKGEKIVGELEQREIEEAETFMFHKIQEESFPLNQNVVENLQVVRGEDDLLRIKTKITNMPESESFRKPVLLPSNHPVVWHLIRSEHILNMHAGLSITMSKLRERFWIIHLRQQVKKVIRQCVICRRFTTKKSEVPCPPLPEDRVTTTAKVFQVVGIDLAGPFFLKNGSKAWMVLYTCAVYRAIHLELVSSLSTEDFLLSLHRFISRRGRPAIIYSDNGTNFEGANNAIKLMDWKRIEQESRVSRIKWKFSAPAAPWWGGWWERLIRSCKDIMKRMLGRKKLNLAELETCMFEVEAVVNSRPLTYMSEEQDDLVPLTPAMFLHDITEADFPEEELLDGQALRSKYRDLRQLRQELKSRFVKEYLSQLVQRGKEKKSPEFRVGDVVLIGSDDKRRIIWPMARILELIVGRDGHVRVAKLKTANGLLTRPLQRLFPLEVSTEEIPQIQNRVKISAQVWESVDAKKEENVRTRFGRQIRNPERFGV
ncbi:Pro-Pol polyprotein [Folsomia candida]|uniref:Pro-Pol polyprotein n=1 Tax=Folsomia candida TaxID=158441 RepID=A0A226F7A4_FOLCA|nr:Pro-Pol polyprotein [Folsomia candida]